MDAFKIHKAGLRRSAETPPRQDDFSATSLLSVLAQPRACAPRSVAPAKFGTGISNGFTPDLTPALVLFLVIEGGKAEDQDEDEDENAFASSRLCVKT